AWSHSESTSAGKFGEATSGPARIRGASRVSRDAPSVGGFGRPDEFEARHGFPGTRRASGGWGARRIRGASRVSRDAPSGGGFGGPYRGPPRGRRRARES